MHPFRSVTIPISLRDDVPRVEVRVGRQRARFLLDSGAAVTVLTPDAARRLGKERTRDAAVLQGAATVTADKVRLPEISLGDARLPESDAYVAALPGLDDCDGLLGGPLFARFALTIDYERARLTLTEPSALTPPPGATRLPLRLRRGLPFVDGAADGRPGLFELDTGAGGTVTLFAPFVERYRLREILTPRFETVTGRAIGGVLRGDIVRLPTLSIGAFTIVRPLVELSRQSAGAFFDSEAAGNIGAQVLRRFTLTFDFSGERVFLSRNRFFGQEFVANRSGLALEADGEGLIVVDVWAGSPAAETGVRTGDRVLSVDDMPAGRLGLDAIRERLRRAPGTKVLLRVQSGSDSPRPAALILRELL
jgi:predicted aspartyl protease